MKKIHIEESVELAVPARTAYDQWTQFEEFPRFLKDVVAVRQLDDRHLEWRARIAVREFQGRAEICEQIPDKRIAWRSVAGPHSAGVVTFHRLSEDRSRVMVQIEHEPEGVVETLAGVLGTVRRQVQRSLAAFKEFIELRGKATGGWRKSIPSPDESGEPQEARS